MAKQDSFLDEDVDVTDEGLPDSMEDFMGGGQDPELSKSTAKESSSGFFTDAPQEMPIPELSQKKTKVPAKKKSNLGRSAIKVSLVSMLAACMALGVLYYIRQPHLEEKKEAQHNIPKEPIPMSDPHLVDMEKPETPYHLFITDCMDQECVADYRTSLQADGYEVRVTKKREQIPVIEVLSSDLLPGKVATQWTDRINQEHSLMGVAYRKLEGKQYRLSLGVFPDKTHAHYVAQSLNHRYSGELRFTENAVHQSITYHSLEAGDFETQEDALHAQKSLFQRDPKFGDVRVIQTPNP